jgi:tRNA dimethylallyltransferase
MDIPHRLVAPMSPARTANGGFAAESIAGDRTPAQEQSFVTGHDFSRAEEARETEWALAPADPLAVLILGPTGSGKTALSLTLAEQFKGEIVSCDSVAVYRGMELGTAKPTAEERARVPHHLIDVANPDEPFTAGAYSRLARELLQEIKARKRLPIVTGGTGLYLRALTDGLFAGPARHEPLRARLSLKAQKHGSAWLHRILTRLDPASAARIHANDTPKLIRAIEVCVAARRPLSEVMARDPLTGFRLLRIGLNPPRATLYNRLNTRCAAMFAAGLVEETRSLLARYGPVKALDSLGYRQALAVLAGTLSLEAGVTATQQGHRNYAKRQLTWFRREPDVHWLAGFGDDGDIAHAAAELVAAALSAK